MCGRYGFIPGSKEQFKKRFKLSSLEFELRAHYNVTPGQQMPVVTRHSPNTAEEMKWGLVPFWAKDPRIGYKMINARSETVADKPSFRRALLRQRCLIPASGFYEWKKSNGTKQPFFIKLKNSQLFSFAGLYDIWKDAEGRELKTYTIITTEPNNLLAPIHNRMSVIFDESEEGNWLNQSTQISHLLTFLKPYVETHMITYPVSTKVNNPENDSQQLIEPQK